MLVVINAYTLREGEELIVANRLKEVLSRLEISHRKFDEGP